MSYEEVEKRAVEAAVYFIENNSTIRETAKVLGYSKSTIHKDLTETLPKINPHLANVVRELLDSNKAERHIRGGKATKEKYLNERSEKKNEPV